MKKIRLDVGCGSKETKKKGYTGVDAYTDDADIRARMWELPFDTGTVDEVYSAQALEHVGKVRVLQTLEEFKRVLKIGGKLELRVPDLEWACMWWLQHQSTGWDLDIIYGTQLHDGEFHKTGFNTKIIWDYLQVVGGFDIQSISYDGGKSELKLVTEGISTEVAQRIIVVKAVRVEQVSILSDEGISS